MHQSILTRYTYNVIQSKAILSSLSPPPPLKIGELGHYLSLQQHLISTPIPRHPSHRPHIHVTRLPASRAGQPERTTWQVELGNGWSLVTDGWHVGQAELGRGK
jgi:hypothetical protein